MKAYIRIGVVKFSTPKYQVVKSMMFLHCNIHKYIWTSPGGEASQPDRQHIDR
jgi:hypothetical protein